VNITNKLDHNKHKKLASISEASFESA